MASDNIFSGLKVVDFATFVAGPSAAVILSDFGADVVKVEPPSGDLWRHAHQIPPMPPAKDAYPFHLANRNKRGIVLNLKSPSAQQVLEKLVKWADVFIVNTPHPARKKLKLEYADVVQWNPRLIYADLTGFGEKGPDASLPGFDLTAYWARSGLLSMTRDAGAPPTWPVAGSGDNATAVGIYSAIVTALYRRERTGEGAYVTTSLPPRACGRQACRSRPRCATQSLQGCTIAVIRRAPQRMCIAPPTARGLFWPSHPTNGRMRRKPSGVRTS